MLDVENLAAGYGRVQVLWDVSLQVQRHEIVALIGPNGAGKTTLLRALSGIIPVAGGTVRLHGKPINGRSVEDIAYRGVTHVPEGRRLFAGLTVRENLLLGAWRRRDKNLEPVLELFPNLRGRLNQVAGSMSGGEQQMCAIARGLMSQPALMMIDELSLGLAPKVVEEIMQRLPDIAASGTAILVVEQDVDAALTVAERAYVLENGHITMDGQAASLLADPKIRMAYLGVA
ncbi:ABC transporter ATP-binding protein [Rugosimonospora acidiphila]|uniref:ABC transporter ATP-binding protein n=1 Tax=Rugosimonospora acidiphila TaxID=556531 RepID=A0ABP9RN98_9ACTN